MKAVYPALVTVFAFAGSLAAQVDGSPKTPPPEATINATISFGMVSAFTHEAYRIKVFLPHAAAPASGYPTLYLLDGNVLFGTFTNAVRNQSQAGEIESAVVVGIESGAGPQAADRTYDFTSADLTPLEKKLSADLGPNPRFGGYDDFFSAIQQEIKPAVARYAHVDEKRSAIFGWSLGGLFVAHTMLTHPDAFQSYVSLSPSLWRSGKLLFTEIPAFEQTAAQQNPRLRLFLGVGGREEQPSPGLMRKEADPKTFALEMAYAHMRTNAENLNRQLAPYFVRNGLRYSFRVFEGDSHNSVPWDSVNPVLQFLFTTGEIYDQSG